MQKIVTLSAILALATFAWAGSPATQPATQKTAAKKSTPVAAKKSAATATTATVRKTSATVPGKKPATATTTAAKRSATTTASAARKGKKGPVKPATSWRNRQTSPTSDRYKEIQDALVARGYLPSEQATGLWSDASAQALKRFQEEQTIESTGKINSLSLIALGLGPKHDSIST